MRALGGGPPRGLSTMTGGAWPVSVRWRGSAGVSRGVGGVIVRNGKLGRGICEVVPPYVGVCYNLPHDCGIAVFPTGLQEVCDALKEKHVVMVVGGYGQPRYLVVESDCLDVGQGVREDS